MSESAEKDAGCVPIGPAWNGVTRAWVIKTLAAHRLTIGRCSCGWTIPPNAPMLPAHDVHVAEVLIPTSRSMGEARRVDQRRSAITARFRPIPSESSDR